MNPLSFFELTQVTLCLHLEMEKQRSNENIEPLV